MSVGFARGILPIRPPKFARGDRHRVTPRDATGRSRCATGTSSLAELDRPVFVTGTPRSGKSLICKLLAQADEFHFAVEPLSLWEAGFASGADDCRQAEEASSEAARRAVRRAAEMTREAGKRRYLDDLSYHALRLPFLARLVPDAKIILAISDGQHAIPEMIYGWTNQELLLAQRIAYRRKNLRWSALPRLAFRFVRNQLASRLGGRKHTWGPRVPGQQEFAATHPPAVVAAHQWMKMIEIALRDRERLGDSQILEVRYERLLVAPEEEARRIAEFCGVEDSEAIVENAARLVDPGFRHDWRSDPSDAEWGRIRELIAPLQQRLGYWTEEEARSAPNPADGARERER